jgi:hypothetical protein
MALLEWILKEIDINTEDWIDEAWDRGLLDSPCDCVIEPPSSISHGVSYKILSD